MPDITMCTDKHCPLKKTCYRYIAKPSFMQSYFLDSPRTDKSCDYYWKTKENDKT